jgi:iron-sulfur cluster repair protein YtfE (RIC family)
MTEIELPPARKDVFRTCTGLQALEANLREHIFLENNIFFPRAEEAENPSGEN